MFWKHWVDLNRKNESWALVSHDHKNLMLECPRGCMHDQFCIKFLNHHLLHVYHGNNVGTSPLSPNHWPNPDIYHVQLFYKPWAKISTYHKPWPRLRMSILALGRKWKKGEKVPDQRSEESKKRKSPIKDWEKAKKRKKIPDQRSEENKRNI